MSLKLRIHKIIKGTTVDGPGFRTSIYFAGCDHQCPGCQNPQTWDPESGYDVDMIDLIEEIKEAEMDVTLTGGDPLYQYAGIEELCRRLTGIGIGIWLYTGYTFEQILSRFNSSGLLNYIDVVVDGPFIEAERDINLLFRGSKNQRLIDVKKTKENGGEIVIWESDF